MSVKISLPKPAKFLFTDPMMRGGLSSDSNVKSLHKSALAHPNRSAKDDTYHASKGSSTYAN